MPIRSSNGFSHLQWEVFHISFQAHKAKHTQTRGWKKRRTKNHGLGLAPSARREKFVILLRSFLCICELSRACIRAKFPHSHQECWLIVSRWLTQPLSPQVLAVAFLWPSASPNFCWLLSPADCHVLFWDLTFPRLLLVSWEILRASPLCEFCANTD